MARFKKIYIEITNRCNLSCSFCPQSLRNKAFMTPDAFAEVLEKISGFTEYIYLHVLGEPLLHPDLALLLDISKTHGFRVNLTTNGTLLRQQGNMLLMKAALRQVNISLHSIEQSESEDFFLYLDGVLNFIREAGNPPPLFINLRLWNLHESTACLNRKILERLASLYNLSDPVSRDFTCTCTLSPRVFLSWDHPFTWPHSATLDLGGRGHCRGLKDHVAILVDGTVVPCCLDAEADIPLGDIKLQSLADILAGPRAVSMQRGFAGQQIVDPLCRRCGYKNRFVSSPANPSRI